MLDRAYLARGFPTLIMWGRRDAIIPLGHGRLAHAALAGSDLEIFDDAGHFPHHVDPARFVRVLHEFISRTEPASFDAEEWRDRLRRGGRAIQSPTSAPDAPDATDLTDATGLTLVPN
jgi:hypothetical protein